MHAPLTSAILAVLVSAALALNQPPAPAGRPYTEVHEIPAGGTIVHVGRDIHLLAANGTILHVSVNVKLATTPATPPEHTGWITYANWLNTSPSPISVFNTSWTVPAAPSNYDGQTIFLFNAIEPGAGDAIIQPVLQYGPSAAGGDAYWAVATWYLYGPDVFHTPLLPVDVGQTLRGMISLLGQSGGTYDYNSQFTNIEGTSLSVTGAEQMAWATVTLEAYEITSSSDYPPGASSFYEISFAFSGLAPQVHWEVVNDEDDGLSTVVNSDGSLFGVVTLTY
ncbi:hypothetical protein C8R46DRAFT_1040625 [Mycena filopes]|nr:hypothetical protein C8R46DRAFT_1040625 [Mycena filopes]